MIRCQVAKSSVDQGFDSGLVFEEESSGSLSSLISVEGKVWLRSGSSEESESDESVSEVLGFVSRFEPGFTSGDELVGWSK